MLEIIKALIGSSITHIPIYVFGKIIFNNYKMKNKAYYSAIIIILGVFLHTMGFMLFEGTTKTLILCIILMLTFKFLFNISYGKSLLAALVYLIVLIIPDLIVTISFSTIFGKEYFYNNMSGGIISNVTVCLLMISTTYILRKPLRRIINYNFSMTKKIIIVSTFTLISLAIFFYSLINAFEFSNNIASSLVVIFTLILILFYLFKQKNEIELALKKYDELLSIMKNYESDIEEQRTVIHENKNELLTIKSKIEDKEKEHLIIDYIDSILGDKKSSKMSKYSKFKYLPSNGIKGFFYYKFNEAEKRGIKVSVNISKKIENSFLGNLNTKDFKDLVRMIGVYLDNAIDASDESKDKKLGIEIYSIKDDIEIIISNTLKHKIDKDKIGKERFTTKGKNHGHGLLLVKSILYSNSIFEADTEITNELYIQKLKIKNSK